MKLKKMNWITAIVLFTISIIGTALLFPEIPEEIPIHWNISGNVDNWAVKDFLWGTASLPIILMLLFSVIPQIDPKKDNYKLHTKAYNAIILGILIIFSALHWVIILFSSGLDIDVTSVIPALIGLLFIVMGNFMPQTRHNYTMGFKTPWTLDSETVWKKTHRSGGIVMIFSGLLIVLSALFFRNYQFILFFIAILGLLIFVYLFSYLAHRKERIEADKEDNKAL